MSVSNIYRLNQYTWSCNHEQGGDWTTQHNRTSAVGGSGQNTNIRSEVYRGGGSYDIYRSGASFDTSGIPANATITSAILYHYRRREYNGQLGCTLYIQSMSDIGVDVGFYNQAYFGALVGVFDSPCAYMSELNNINSYVGINLDVGAIVKAGTTKLGFRTAHDYANSAPGNDGNSTSISGSDWTGTQNYLAVTWTTPPAVATGAATNKSVTTVTLAGNVTDAGGGTVGERGIVYGTGANPTTANSKKAVSGTTGAFTADIDSLGGSTLYHYRAYVITENSTQYGADQTFTTLPSVETSAMTNIGVGSAKANGNVTSSGAEITERGFVYGFTTAPTVSDTKVVVSGTTGVYNVLITALAIGRKIYLRSFATNATGTVYGSEVNFIMFGGAAIFSSL